MRVLAIGLGGAGSRIVDKLYDHDRRSKICCMNAIAIDVDSNTLSHLRHLPDTARIFFPPIDLERPDDIGTTIDIEEVMTRIQRMDTLEIDAILMCCGLGGSMVDIAPAIIKEIRISYLEPIFALVTLPCRGEGRKVSAKAADDVEKLKEIVDATILFDNDTWYEKIKSMIAALEGDRTTKAGSGSKNRVTSRNPRDIYNQLNERIVRQIGLLLRAGEFNEHGLEVAEVVLDAGEVLNTLRGQGYVAVGYASEELPTSRLSIFNRWRSSQFFMEGSQQKAARIVSLAKKAVYEDISVPCDLTSAERALVLIAGPSAELSMRGFQTVRKWIDRSIAGLEMRSGDYPVKNTSYVGIIVVLSGMHNIPRIEELKHIREEYRHELESMQNAEDTEPEPDPDNGEDDDVLQDESKTARIMDESEPTSVDLEGKISIPEREMLERDEMISLPGAKGKQGGASGVYVPGRGPAKQDDGALILPQAPGRSKIDITGSATVSNTPAPKNSVFEPKDAHLNSAPKENDFRGGLQAFVSPVQRPKEGAMTGEQVPLNSATQRPKDTTMTGEAISLSGSNQRPKDSAMTGDTVPIHSSRQRAHDEALEGRDVPVAGRSKKPSDDMLSHSNRGFSRGGPRPKDSGGLSGSGTPGASKPDASPEKKKPQAQKPQKEPEDDDISWFI